MIRLACILAAACCAAAEPVWDWLPTAADDDRTCELHLTASDGWEPTALSGLASERAAGQLILRFSPRTVPALDVAGPGGRRIGVRLLAPGHGAGLACDGDGQLGIGGDAAILAVPRREAAADRRWGILRLFDRDVRHPCSLRLPAPMPSAPGRAVLTSQIAAAQALQVSGAGVLVELSGDDRFAAWKHREYRQALAWLVADLAARGATHVVLVEPTCPVVDEPLLAPLRAQVRDVAVAYRCSAIDTTAIGEHACWEVSPGVLGTALNRTGRERLEGLLGPWLAGGR